MSTSKTNALNGGGAAQWGILGGQGGLDFITILLLKYICLVFHGDLKKWIYSDNLFIYKHIVSIVACIDL